MDTSALIPFLVSLADLLLLPDSLLAATLALFVSGFVLWFPEWMPRSLRLISIAAHPLAAIGSITSILVHVYMGTAAVPQSMRAMLRGHVVSDWARFHHPKWYKTWRASNDV